MSVKVARAWFRFTGLTVMPGSVPRRGGTGLVRSCRRSFQGSLAHDAVDLVSSQTDVCGAALTDEVDVPAEPGAGAGVAAPSDQHLTPARAPRRYRVRRGMLAA